MKILFISKSELPDFQNDMVFHGMRTLYGDQCVDINKVWYMYKSDKQKYWNNRVPRDGKSFGGGFTLYGRLDDIFVDRTDIEKKIEDKFFDKIVYGSVHRCLDYIDLVLSNYERENIIFIDGEDFPENIKKSLLGSGLYFKRELNIENDYLKPINFAIPEELIVNKISEKQKDYGEVIPGDISTYIYDNEKDYYTDYQKSYFGITSKKGGWDCLRHYEILMNGCIPYFPGIENCPNLTMTKFPKEKILESNTKVTNGTLDVNWYTDINNFLLEHTKNNLTTKSLAKEILK